MIQKKHNYNDYGDSYPNSRKVYITGSRSILRFQCEKFVYPRRKNPTI